MRLVLRRVLVTLIYGLPLVPLFYAASQGPEPVRMGDHIRQHVECYRELLLQEWVVDVRFERMNPDSEAAYPEALPEYFEGTIVVDTLQFLPSELKPLAAHEVVHLVEWELGTLAEQVDEDLAIRYQEQIATRFDRALRPLCPDTLLSDG